MPTSFDEVLRQWPMPAPIGWRWRLMMALAFVLGLDWPATDSSLAFKDKGDADAT